VKKQASTKDIELGMCTPRGNVSVKKEGQRGKGQVLTELCKVLIATCPAIAKIIISAFTTSFSLSPPQLPTPVLSAGPRPSPPTILLFFLLVVNQNAQLSNHPDFKLRILCKCLVITVASVSLHIQRTAPAYYVRSRRSPTSPCAYHAHVA